MRSGGCGVGLRAHLMETTVGEFESEGACQCHCGGNPQIT